MSTQKINAGDIKSGDIQNISADLTKFDAAKAVVGTAKEVLSLCLVINSKQEQENALQYCKEASQVLKAIETRRKELVGPFNDSVKAINGYAKELSAELDELVNQVKGSILKFQRAEEERARQAMITARQGQLTQLGFNYSSSSDHYELDGVGLCTMREIGAYNDQQWRDVINGFIEAISKKSQQQVAQLEEEKELTEMFGSEEQKAEINDKLSQVASSVTTVTPVNGHKVDAVKGTTKRWVHEITDPNLVPKDYWEINESLIRIAIRDGVRDIPGVRIYQSESLTIR